MNVVETNNQPQETTYHQLLSKEPKLLTATVAANAKEQKQQFLSGATELPIFVYERLQEITSADFEEITHIGHKLQESLADEPKYLQAYAEFVDTYLKKTRLLQVMNEYNHADDESAKNAAHEEFMRLNIELFGEPDEVTYRTILAERVARIDKKNLSGRALELRDELHDMLPSLDVPNGAEKFRPLQETIDWVHDIAVTLYGDIVSHIPDQEMFTDEEIKHIFEEILDQEFGESARGWRVEIEDNDKLSISAADKKISVPRGVELTKRQLTLRTVHEIGVHVMRAITGESTTLLPLRLGLDQYYDAEEGAGMVMEQAWEGIFKEMGLKHYTTIGLVYFDSMNFRQAFEINWRINALTKIKSGSELTDEQMTEARNVAYVDTDRILRGTGELPLFKDLAYYNGSMNVWKFLESIRGDDFRFTLFMMGKMNTGLDHLRTILEAKPSV